MIRIEVEYHNEESMTVTLYGKYIASANHDEDGWQGMEQLESMARNFAFVSGFEIDIIGA